MSVLRGDFDGRFAALAGDLLHQARVPRMAEFCQHGTTSTLAHVTGVARTALKWADVLPAKVSEAELVRGALLHDYYLYDWHEPGHTGHATRHPLRAEANAAEDFDLTPKERNIIAAHMWPLPPTRVPASPEAWLVCLADKWCSLCETFRRTS